MSQMRTFPPVADNEMPRSGSEAEDDLSVAAPAQAQPAPERLHRHTQIFGQLDLQLVAWSNVNALTLLGEKDRQTNGCPDASAYAGSRARADRAARGACRQKPDPQPGCSRQSYDAAFDNDILRPAASMNDTASRHQIRHNRNLAVISCGDGVKLQRYRP